MVSSASVGAHESIALSEEEFKMAQHYKSALEDTRVQAMKPAARMAAIAKDAGYKLAELQRAIDKADAAGDVKAKCEENLKEALARGALAGRIGRIEVDTTAAQAVTYVQWFNEEAKELATEASIAAAVSAQSCPVSSTITVWAQDKSATKTRVFQALISSTGARRINLDKVKDFANTRYLKLFEQVKTAANGDDMTAEAGARGVVQ
jgi:hypothetical protein